LLGCVYVILRGTKYVTESVGELVKMAIESILPEFQKFLRDRKLGAEKDIPFTAYWAYRFLKFIKGSSAIDSHGLTPVVLNRYRHITGHSPPG
jgi:hypothetical protein